MTVLGQLDDLVALPVYLRNLKNGLDVFAAVAIIVFTYFVGTTDKITAIFEIVIFRGILRLFFRSVA